MLNKLYVKSNIYLANKTFFCIVFVVFYVIFFFLEQTYEFQEIEEGKNIRLFFTHS